MKDSRDKLPQQQSSPSSSRPLSHALSFHSMNKNTKCSYNTQCNIMYFIEMFIGIVWKLSLFFSLTIFGVAVFVHLCETGFFVHAEL